MDFQLSQEYMEKSSAVSGGNIQLLDYFTDILPLDSSGANAKLMGQITYALVFARSLYARHIEHYDQKVLQSSAEAQQHRATARHSE